MAADTKPTRARRWKLRHTLRAISALLVVIAVIYFFTQRKPTAVATGTSFEGHAYRDDFLAAQGDRLRLATFNIHSGRSAAGEGSLARTSTELGNRWHLVALQEVRGRDDSGPGNQAQLLGNVLGMSYLFAPTERRMGRDDFGSGAPASVPVTRWTRTPMPRAESRAYRNYFVVEFAWRQRTVSCLMTHIDSTGDRDAQLAHVIEMFLALPPPAILMGDLNATRKHPALAALLAEPGVVDAVSASPADPPAHRIDWIITRGFKRLDSGVKFTDASDHPIVWTEVRLAD